MPSDKSINTLAHASAGPDPEKAHGRDGFGSDHHLGRRHADDEDGDDVEETDDDHDSESTRAGEIQPVQSRSQSIINRVLSTRSIDPGPPPDGGWSAWITALCAHLIVMNSWGFINSFGIFQTYYAEILDMPPSTISWIGSIQVFLLFSIGTLTGRITDAGYFRPVLIAGSALQVLGIFSASFASTYAQFFLAQGVCMGLANGFVFCPTIATLSTYFSSKRSLAIGIGACGSATGGIIFPLIARFLIPRAGLLTLRTIGFVQLVALVFCNFFLKPRVPPQGRAPG
ncbi:unnamed protein product [Parascedosporium putredinis]|uniref:Major facilitator superfamily (MFS) profile domain-containing protein n=1 Tax=Parascedosporium putredinis TaxID=1442378 RepID=A0A9P1M9H6_9PEZI|nr:unnamed protein product [Parascedosporium putredinis]CAI7992105.1 unnamed protein product [Parascedosporium putredinis]